MSPCTLMASTPSPFWKPRTASSTSSVNNQLPSRPVTRRDPLILDPPPPPLRARATQISSAAASLPLSRRTSETTSPCVRPRHRLHHTPLLPRSRSPSPVAGRQDPPRVPPRRRPHPRGPRRRRGQRPRRPTHRDRVPRPPHPVTRSPLSPPSPHTADTNAAATATQRPRLHLPRAPERAGRPRGRAPHVLPARIRRRPAPPPHLPRPLRRRRASPPPARFPSTDRLPRAAAQIAIRAVPRRPDFYARIAQGTHPAALAALARAMDPWLAALAALVARIAAFLRAGGHGVV